MRKIRFRCQHKLVNAAGIAQLVEHDLAKVGVASSNLVSRSRFQKPGLVRGRVFCFWLYWPPRQHIRLAPETRLVKVYSLHIYPVKSLAGIQVSSFEMDDFGPKGDRRWMIIDEDRRFVTQRALPELARVTTSVGADGVSVHVPGEGEFTLQVTDHELRVLVWRDWVKACEGAAATNEALSRFCGKDLRFVHMPDTSFRRVDVGRVTEYRRVGFADGFPFLITSLASLEDLNERLDAPVDMRRFRPNIVVAGSEPWQEDRWSKLKLGEQSFDIVKPSSRCVLTTVDPDTGIKDPGQQPLRMLSSYRRTSDGVIFGQNAIHETPGVVHVDDSVTVIESE